jgi:hypothetical protein
MYMAVTGPCGQHLKFGYLNLRLFYTSGSNLFSLSYPWQPISVNCTLHISEMFVINIVAVISNLFVATVNKQPNNGIFPLLYNFFRLTLNVLVRTPKGTRNPGWESLLYTTTLIKIIML